MDDKLSKEEERVLVRIESAGKWDILIHDLAYLVPSSIIIILSAIFASIPGIFIGLLTYSILHLWTSVRQCKSMPVIQSAIFKIKNCHKLKNSAEGY